MFWYFSYFGVLVSIQIWFKNRDYWGTWVAQWVKVSAFGSGHDPRVLGSSPTLGSLLSREPASSSLSACLSAYLWSLSVKQINKKISQAKKNWYYLLCYWYYSISLCNLLHPCRVSGLKGKAVSFSPLRMILAVGFSFSFSFKILFIYLTEITSRQRSRQRERRKQAPRWAESPTRGPIPGPWDQDPSQKQRLQPTEPPRRPWRWALFKSKQEMTCNQYQVHKEHFFGCFFLLTWALSASVPLAEASLWLAPEKLLF